MTVPPAAPVTLRRSAGDRYSILLLGGFLVLITALMLVSAIAILSTMPGTGVFILVVTAALMALLVPMWTETQVRWRTRIEIGDRDVHFGLPARRGYIRQAPFDAVVPLTDIVGLEMRVEAFRALGNTVLQRAFSMRLRNGTRIVLGGDRRVVSNFFEKAAGVLAERTATTVRDLGTVDGNPGFLMMWGQTVPSWDAAPMSPEKADLRARQESAAWRLVGIVFGAMMLVRLLVWIFSRQ